MGALVHRDSTEAAMTTGKTAGGLMYHDRGFAGLPESEHPNAGLLDQDLHVGPRREHEISNGHHNASVESPLSIPGALLLKEIHSRSDR
jgi:hypothetical protein